MRCKNHRNDQSSTVGVCATCLRERLSAAIAAQTQARLGSNGSGFKATWHQPGVGPASGAELKMHRNGGRVSSLLSGLLRSRVGSVDPGSGQQHGSFVDSSPSRFPGVSSSGCRETSPASFPRAEGSPSTGGSQRRMAEREKSLSVVGMCWSPLFGGSPTGNRVLLAKSTTSFCKSGSRKLADMGRYCRDPNR